MLSDGQRAGSRYRDAGIPANRAENVPCNRVCRASKKLASNQNLPAGESILFLPNDEKDVQQEALKGQKILPKLLSMPNFACVGRAGAACNFNHGIKGDNKGATLCSSKDVSKSNAFFLIGTYLYTTRYIP